MICQLPSKIKTKKLSFVPERKAFQREKRTNLYNTHRWRKERKSFLEDNPLCVSCEANGVVKAAKVVDHVIRFFIHGDFWDRSNWQSLCKKCHNIKSAKESRGMG